MGFRQWGYSAVTNRFGLKSDETRWCGYGLNEIYGSAMGTSQMSIRNVVITLGIMGLLGAVALMAMIPNFVRSGPGPLMGIVNTLRQIDGAKEQYAIDHKAEAGAVLSREQLLRCLPERFWDRHADYRINPIGVYPEAILPKKFGGLPAKTIIRVQDPTNRPGYLIILPKDAHG